MYLSADKIPSPTRHAAWFPRLESDEVVVVDQLEDMVRQAEENIRSHPFPTYVGQSAPEEEVREEERMRVQRVAYTM